MSTVQHTPGPWRVGPYDDRCNGFSVQAGGFEVAAALYMGGTAQAEINARLIAAAPDLLKLAHQYSSECGECGGVGIDVEDHDCAECKFIRDVIAKVQP